MWHNNGPAIYVTADKRTMVPEGDPRAAFLLVAAGGQLADDEAARYGLTDDEAAPKAAAAPDNKAKVAPTNKARG